MMKSWSRLLVVTVAAHTTALAGEFTRTLTPEDLKVTGLSKLTPEELAALDLRIENYKNGVTPRAPEAVPDQARAPAAAVEARPNPSQPDWVGALITLKRAENNPGKSQALESRLVGDFTGWYGRTSFQLENGQRWAQANNDTYAFTPALRSPRVKIYPAAFGTFWLEIEGSKQRCRVKPVKFE